MKALSLLALVAPLVEAHYIFNILYVNGKAIGGEYDYVRKNSNSYNPTFPDILTSNDLRCNRGAKPISKTYPVQAGDKVALKIFNRETVEHPGPGFVYMSKAPGKVSEYDGSGDWFKVWESGLCGGSPGNDGSWCTWQKDRLEFQIPKNIPPGEYLVRFEHIGLHEGHVGKAQLYMECTQLSIEGPGGGTPAPLVKIPGIYKATDPGIRFDKWNNPKTYVMPGPKVWDGQ